MADTGKTIALIKALGGSGGGSGLPTPTADDVGKVATVVGETSKGAVIVPEQTVTSEGSHTPLTAQNRNMFVEGADVIITMVLGGETNEFESKVEAAMDFETGVIIYQAYFANREAYLEDNGVSFTLNGIPDGVSVTISCHVANKTVSWGAKNAFVIARWNQDDSLDKTWQEIHDADFAVIRADYTYYYIYAIEHNSLNSYTVSAYDFFSSESVTFETDSADGYPVFS